MPSRSSVATSKLELVVDVEVVFVVVVDVVVSDVLVGDVLSEVVIGEVVDVTVAEDVDVARAEVVASVVYSSTGIAGKLRRVPFCGTVAKLSISGVVVSVNVDEVVDVVVGNVVVVDVVVVDVLVVSGGIDFVPSVVVVVSLIEP